MNARRAENLSNVPMTFRSLLCVGSPTGRQAPNAKANLRSSSRVRYKIPHKPPEKRTQFPQTHL
jgi:hypothetical protein